MSDKKLILTAGYIREHEKMAKLFGIIPLEIVNIIYSFHKWCDEWNIEHSGKIIEINVDDNSITTIAQQLGAAFGDEIVKCGSKFVLKLFVSKNIENPYNYSISIKYFRKTYNW